MKIIKKIKKSLYLIGEGHRLLWKEIEEICPVCGYYCTCNKYGCNPPLNKKGEL